MLKEFNPSAAVHAFHDLFNWAYLNVDKSANKQEAQNFGVHSIPHVVIVQPNGTIMDTIIGGISPMAFTERLSQALNP